MPREIVPRLRVQQLHVQRSLKNFTDITGSFFATAWYGGVAVSKTTGTDNVPGATRGGTVGGGTVNETLTTYFVHPDALPYTYHGRPWTYSAPNQRPLHFAGYAETIRFESICGGKATYIDFISYLWMTRRLPDLAAKLGEIVIIRSLVDAPAADMFREHRIKLEATLGLKG
ncbi:hypothetical protein FB451DRAFT_1403253 [Mycena latifolia]|nr:hypothetical protein FB451DRAFT_1403253 [Mycena latifolia]